MSVLDELAAAGRFFYAHEPIPVPLDDAVDRWIGAQIETGSVFSDEVGSEHGAALIAFAERSASRAVRAGDAAIVVRGLVAIALAWRACDDVTDAIPALGLLHAAAARLGADPAALFGRVERLAPGDTAPVFRDFLTRRDLARIDAVMGYIEGGEAGGFRYYRTW